MAAGRTAEFSAILDFGVRPRGSCHKGRSPAFKNFLFHTITDRTARFCLNRRDGSLGGMPRKSFMGDYLLIIKGVPLISRQLWKGDKTPSSCP